MNEETRASESTADKIVRLRAEKAKRDADVAKAKEASTLEGLELEAKYEQELGRRGVAFAMIDASDSDEGYIVVKLGADLTFRQYLDAVAKGDTVSAADLFSFVGPSVVYPTQEVYADIVRRRGFIANRCADALAFLHGVRQQKIEGKY